MATLTDDEETAIISAFQATADALRRIRIALEQQLEASTDPQEKKELALQINEVMQQIADNDEQFDNFLDGNIALVPPSRDELDAVVKNAAQVAQFTTEKATAAALVNLATRAADLLHAATT
jgi:hypothetical protein